MSPTSYQLLHPAIYCTKLQDDPAIYCISNFKIHPISFRFGVQKYIFFMKKQ
jgi:hypothetical protein